MGHELGEEYLIVKVTYADHRPEVEAVYLKGT